MAKNKPTQTTNSNTSWCETDKHGRTVIDGCPEDEQPSTTANTTVSIRAFLNAGKRK